MGYVQRRPWGVAGGVPRKPMHEFCVERTPMRPVVSCTTGVGNYDEFNHRAIPADWTEQPQRLWDVVKYTLSSSVERVIYWGACIGGTAASSR
jgi:hypothetical protein